MSAVESANLPTRKSASGELCRAALGLGVRHFIRHFVGLGLIFATLAASFYLTVDRVGSSLKHVVEQRVNEMLLDTGWEVQFSSLQFVEGEGIRVRGLQLRPRLLPGGESPRFLLPTRPEHWERWIAGWPGASSTESRFAVTTYRPSYRPLVPLPPVVQVESLWLRGQWTAADLLQAKFRPQSLELDGVTIQLMIDVDQQIALPQWKLPETRTPLSLPESISVRNLVMQVLDPQGVVRYRLGEAKVTMVRLGPPLGSPAPAADPETTPSGAAGAVWPDGNPSVPGRVTAGEDGAATWQIDGDLKWLAEQPLRFQGRVDSQGYALHASCEATYLSPNLWSSLTPWLPEQWQLWTGVSGWLEIHQIVARGNWATGPPAPSAAVGTRGRGRPDLQELQVVGRLSETAIQHARLPQPVLNASAAFQADLQGIRVSDIQGRVAEGAFRGQVDLSNWSAPQVTLQVQGQRLPFSRRWTGLLSDKLLQAWEAFQPEGEFDCDLVFVRHSDGVLERSGSIDVYDLSYLYREFPLPVTQVSGRVILEDDDCRFALESADALCPVTMTGFARNMGPQWTGRIEIRSPQFHSYSDKLLEGLRKKPEAVEVIRQLNFSGLVAANGYIEKMVADQPADVRFNVGIHSGEIRHRLFPYRMFGLSGMIAFANGSVTAESLEGVSSTGNVTISGQFTREQHWSVRVVGQALELNHELYQALSPGVQSVWDQLDPHGTLDHVLVKVENPGSGVQVSVSGYQQPSTARDPSNLRMEPVWFRYGLERLSGKFHYQDGTITISDAQGWHGTVPVSFEAHGQSTAEYWQVTVDNLLTGQIPFNHEIKRALPQALQIASERMGLAGSMAVQGSVSIFQRLVPVEAETRRLAQSQPNATVSPPAVLPRALHQPSLLWNLRLDLENAAAELGLPVRNVHGSLELHGRSNRETAYCGGQWNLDSAMVQGVQLTSIQGPFWCNEATVLLGSTIGQLPADIQTQCCGTLASLTANSLGGRLSLDGQVWLRDETQFQLQTTASHVDLARLAEQFAPETRDIAGQGSASLVLSGSSAGTHSLQGQGKVRIHNARLYEVPFFLQLLKSLQVKTPDKTAFDEGSIDFGIRGSDIECHRIELNGDAISLIGNGRANLNRELDMNFYTVLGRNRIYLPVVSDLLHAGSQQLLWINVKGTVDKPELTRETFRALNEAVRLLLEPPVNQRPQ